MSTASTSEDAALERLPTRRGQEPTVETHQYLRGLRERYRFIRRPAQGRPARVAAAVLYTDTARSLSCQQGHRLDDELCVEAANGNRLDARELDRNNGA